MGISGSDHDRLAGQRLRFAVAVWAAVLLIPSSAHSEIRPLVREMLANLASVNEIGAGVAVGDFERVKRAAAGLEARAGSLVDFDVSRLGVDARLGPAFNAYLLEQQRAARTIAKAANGQDGALVVASVQNLLTSACVACHQNFRERENLMRPPIILMTSFLDAWQDINRGILTENFSLVSRRAHDVQIIGQVFTADILISTAFGIEGAVERREFRKLLREVIAQAKQVERAADVEEIAGIVAATQQMWVGGCIACHEKFRDQD